MNSKIEMKSKSEKSSFRVATPRADSGAGVALIELNCTEAEIARLELPDLRVGESRLCELLRLDRGMVARTGETLWLLMPHGGALIVKLLCEELIERDFREASSGMANTFTEAQSEVEEAMLEVLAIARSPRAVPLLLRQPALWSCASASSDARRDTVLKRLLDPPKIVVLGGANIGKSSLANALARRDVAIVADVPGTTRDYVGVWLELDGVVVRWIDTPGLRETHDELEIEARARAMRELNGAALILLCGDVTQEPPPIPREVPPECVRVVQLRADLGNVFWGADWRVSTRSPSGLSDLAAGIRETLVPQADIDSPMPWTFWDK